MEQELKREIIREGYYLEDIVLPTHLIEVLAKWFVEAINQNSEN